MQRIPEAAARGLRWTQSASGLRGELRAGDEVVGRMERRSIFGTLATSESADGCWTFKRVGFLMARATIRACGSDENIGEFRSNTWTNGGTLELASGTRYRVTTNFWETRLEFLRDDDTPCVTLHTSGIVRRKGDVEVEPSALTHPDTPLLVHFGWYLATLLAAEGGM